MIETPRMLLRDWRATDEKAFGAMNADPRVMEFFPSILTPAETREAIERARAHFDQYGFGMNVVEEKATGAFLGITGVFHPNHGAPYTPCFEIGWRLARAAWNKGFATEAARYCAMHAFEVLRAPELVAVTAPLNKRSRRVMEKLGMTHDPAEDFDHPKVPDGDPLKRHVLYRLRPEQLVRG